MSAATPIVGIGLLVIGWLGGVPMENLALLEHGLMMPAMLVPMLLRLDLYTGRMGRAHSSEPVSQDRRRRSDAHLQLTRHSARG